MAVDTPSFDAQTIAATAVITTALNTVIQEPLKRGIAALWARIFGKKGDVDLEARILKWRQEGDELEGEVRKQQSGVERMRQVLTPKGKTSQES